MRNINLLPWRAALRRGQYQQIFLCFLSNVGLVIISLCVWRAILIKNMQPLKQRNYQIQQQITQLRQNLNLVTSEEISNTKMIVVNLPRLFSLLTKIIPRDMYLQRIKKTAAGVEIYGESQSQASVLAFVRSLQQAGGEAHLRSLQRHLFHVQIARF